MIEKLTDIEAQSALWLKVKKMMEGRIASLRERNDGSLDERKTARVRGGIAELKYLISQGDKKPLPPPEDQFKD